MGNTIKTGETYEHRTHGTVEVTRIVEQVDEIAPSGPEYTYIVKFTSAPGSDLVTNHQMHDHSYESFVNAIEERDS